MRYLFTIVGVLLVLGTIAAVKGAQILSLMQFGEEAQAKGPPPEAVETAIAKTDVWRTRLSAVGSVATSRGLTIQSEVAGTVTRIHFESGAQVAQGDVLVELDTTVERAQLASALAAGRLADRQAARSRFLYEGGALSASDADADITAARGRAADAEALRAQIAKKVIRAPYSGRVGIRRVERGDYLNPGMVVTELEAVTEIFVDFTLPQRLLGLVSVGLPVNVDAGIQSREPIAGSVQAVAPALDPATRSVALRAALVDDNALQPGMFVDVEVVLPEETTSVVIPQTAVVYAPYGNSVFVVEDKDPDAPGMRETEDGEPVKVAEQRFVRTGRTRGDFVEITEGVEAGEEIVTVGSFKLQPGAPIVVREGTLTPEMDPRPENR